MCGINGFVSAAERSDLSSKMEQMNSEVFHRGPDSSGFHIHRNRLGMSMRRLSIIDTLTGDQPLINASSQQSHNI